MNTKIKPAENLLRKTSADILCQQMDFANKLQYWINTGHWPEPKTCPPDLKPLSKKAVRS